MKLWIARRFNDQQLEAYKCKPEITRGRNWLCTCTDRISCKMIWNDSQFNDLQPGERMQVEITINKISEPERG